MGLDWRPLGKPKPGFEEKFIHLYHLIQGTGKKELSFLDKLQGKKNPSKDELLQDWFEIQIPSYETIKAPKVGRDKVADDWLKVEYDKTDKSISFQQYSQLHNGYYVIELAEETDGVPMYMTIGQDRNVFRAQFLDDCKELIGEALYDEAWKTKLSEETLKYGEQLLTIADKVASDNNLLYLKEQRIPSESDEDNLESKIHILYSASKWLTFYGKNGHGYEADF